MAPAPSNASRGRRPHLRIGPGPDQHLRRPHRGRLHRPGAGARRPAIGADQGRLEDGRPSGHVSSARPSGLGIVVLLVAGCAPATAARTAPSEPPRAVDKAMAAALLVRRMFRVGPRPRQQEPAQYPSPRVWPDALLRASLNWCTDRHLSLRTQCGSTPRSRCRVLHSKSDGGMRREPSIGAFVLLPRIAGSSCLPSPSFRSSTLARGWALSPHRTALGLDVAPTRSGAPNRLLGAPESPSGPPGPRATQASC